MAEIYLTDPPVASAKLVAAFRLPAPSAGDDNDGGGGPTHPSYAIAPDFRYLTVTAAAGAQGLTLGAAIDSLLQLRRERKLPG